jgi:hypothetical protein
MYRRTSGLIARSRVMVLVAVLGAGTATLVAAPAHAAGLHATQTHAASAHTTSSAPTSAQTMSFHARGHAAPGTKISPFTNPLDITCWLTTVAPSASGTIISASGVTGDAQLVCTYDIDNSHADVPQIQLTNSLYFDSTIVDTKQDGEVGNYFAFAPTLAEPCQHGGWTSAASATVDFPAGYNPQTVTRSSSAQTWFNPGDCPGDEVAVPQMIGLTVSAADLTLQNVGLRGGTVNPQDSCEQELGTIVRTSPSAGSIELKGTTVNYYVSNGPGKLHCA